METDHELRVIADYKEGKKISAIVAEHSINESMVYYLLDKHGVAPSRQHRKQRFTVDGAVATLYEALEASWRAIEKLEQENAELKAQLEKPKRRRPQTK